MFARRLAFGAVVVLLLSGCAHQSDPAPAPAPSGSSSASAGPTSTPEAPVAFVPEGTAQDNKAWFDKTSNDLIASQGDPQGPAFIEALTVAGFDRAAMELTADRTAIDLDADNIQFTVRIGEDCIVGQWGNVGYQSAVLPALDTGKCLIGKTVDLG